MTFIAHCEHTILNFDSIDYLKTGTPRQRKAYQVLRRASVMEMLEKFTPVLSGTIPIGIDIDTSDLDIICCWVKKTEFVDVLRRHFATQKYFTLHDYTLRGHQTVVANFWADDFEFEIFGQARPVQQQESYRHMVIEHHILAERGEPFRKKIIELKKNGLKTEVAFAKLLQLPGQDAYTELLTYGVQHFQL